MLGGAMRPLLIVLATSCVGLACGDDDPDGSGGGGGSGGARTRVSVTTAASSTGSTVATTASSSSGGGGSDGHRIFVTSTKHDGNLGGLVGGDAVCQALADGEGLGGTWMAWLGDGVDGPATRFTQSTTPYTLVSGVVVAMDWADLIDGTLAVPLDHDESGTPLPVEDDMIVFTAVFHTGGNPTPVNCMGWTDASDTIVPTGLASATDTGWTVTAPYPCSEMHHLYCFEQ